ESQAVADLGLKPAGEEPRESKSVPDRIELVTLLDAQLEARLDGPDQLRLEQALLLAAQIDGQHRAVGQRTDHARDLGVADPTGQPQLVEVAKQVGVLVTGREALLPAVGLEAERDAEP